MKILIKVLAVAAAFGLAPAATAQAPQGPGPSQGTAAQAATGNQSGERVAPAAQQTAVPTPAITGAPSEAATESTANAPSAETKDVPAYSTSLQPKESVGQPDGRMGLQDQYTPIGREAAGFHNYILMPAITVISLIVLFLMIYVILRYRRAAHPVPSRTTHNTLVEVLWTLIPVLILVVIAVPSIRLLAHQYSPPNADLTVKVIGNQWFWTYEYPDHGINLTSQMLGEQGEVEQGARFRNAADGPRLLAVDERMVVPVGATVKLIVTSADVIHAFGVPAFWVKMDAVPGRLNETWFKAEQPGIFFGQCYELCGSRHAYMPIAIEVVSQEDFVRWVASKGGTMPGAQPPASPDATQANTLGQQQAGEVKADQRNSDQDGVLTPTNEVQATTNQPVVLERTDESQ
jgi:cytochrome c oxidase subunit 2